MYIHLSLERSWSKFIVSLYWYRTKEKEQKSLNSRLNPILKADETFIMLRSMKLQQVKSWRSRADKFKHDGFLRHAPRETTFVNLIIELLRVEFKGYIER